MRNKKIRVFDLLAGLLEQSDRNKAGCAPTLKGYEKQSLGMVVNDRF